MNGCEYCNGVKKTKTLRFCSRKCAAFQLQKERREKVWRKIEGGITTCDPRQYKSYLIHKRGERCEECFWNKRNPVTKKVPIELEHIDGNSENNRLENLKLLCPNCHSLTPTFKALNKGRGRHKRRQRYKEGKS